MPAYYQATLVIRPTLRAQLYQVLDEFVPLLGTFGFKLLHAFSSVTGNVSTLVHIWEIQDANMLMDGIQSWRDHPDFPRLSAKLYECIISEEVMLLRKTPYSPS